MSKQLTPYQLEAINYKKHISLTANAGSGKTFVLSKRFVEIYKNEEVELSSIAAITFTDKAAGELNKKIADEVDEQLLSVTDAAAKKRLEKLRRELVFANISTIHSFCINILKEFAPEAEIDTVFIPIDKLLADELIEQSIEETMQTIIRDDEASTGLRQLIRLFGSKMFFAKALKASIEKRRIVDALINDLYKKQSEEIAEHYKQEFFLSFDKIFNQKLLLLIEAVKKINSFVLIQKSSNKNALDIKSILEDYTSANYSQKLSHLFVLKKIVTTTSNTIREKDYLGKAKEQFIDEINIIENIFEDLSAFENIDLSEKANYELAKFGKEFAAIYETVEKNYSVKKKARRYLDFEDILLFTQKIIANDSVQKYLQDKYQYIMVDEYQDTNELQYEIIMPILNHLNQGNLFVVGDEKQSIYMFRNAEIEIFNRTKEEIKNTNERGLNLSLPHSFRMYPELVLFTNKLFGKLFENPSVEFNEVATSDLVCTKSLNDKGKIGLLIAENKAEISESHLVASKIVELIKEDKSLQLGEIAVLCRKRKHFTELEKTFAKYGFPFSIIGGKGFYQRQVVYDIYNYVSFLINEKDDQSLIGLLRSPFFNLSDTKIYLISLNEGKHFYEKVIKYSVHDDAVKKVVDAIKENQKEVFGSDAFELIRKLLNDSGYWSLLASKPNSEQEIANIEKLLSLSRSYSNKGFNNVYDFITTLKANIDEYEDEGQAATALENNAVKLMTIHQAKGLEFKAVFVYGTNSKSQEDNLKTREISISKDYGLLTKVPVDKKYFEKYSLPPIASLHNYKLKRKNEAELKRLFYVAVTRAVKYLYLSATISDKEPERNSFYKLLREGFQNNFEEENIYLADKVEFMQWQNDLFLNDTKLVEANITIEKNVKFLSYDVAAKTENNESLIFRNQTINDFPKHEIISATKISMFSQCPVKYELTYDIGYLPIMRMLKQKENDYEFQPSEEESSIKNNAQLRGKIIHKILSDEVDDSDLEDKIANHLVDVKEKDIAQLKKSILDEIKSYYQSKSFLETSLFANYKNEYEVYSQEGEFYLYGIIDKLIFTNNKLLIIDYKTDSIQLDDINKRAENYYPQLKFYAYVLSKIFKDVNLFELQLVFLKHPDELIKTVLSKNEIEEYGEIIRTAINNIHSFNFQKNIVHCKYCQYALKGNLCVKPD